MAGVRSKDGAPKGCNTCSRRRIRCDLALPSCSKCMNRGFACPGYGPRLRWANGVAVRGRLRGQRIPLPQQVSTNPQTSEAHSNREEERSLVISPASLRLTLDTLAPAFIEYYDKNLAGLMVWIDSEENDYRRRVLPLTESAPGLRLAVAAISSHHGSGAFSQDMSKFPEVVRDECLAMVQARVQGMTGRLTGGCELDSHADIADAEWMLASILIISCYEMSNSQVAAAEGHRMAARRLVNIFGHSMEAKKRGLFSFLRNQLAIYDILASTTSFNLAEVQEAILPTPSAENALFSDYLLILHEVTVLSRQAADVASSNDLRFPSRDVPSARSIRSRFSQARGATLLAAGKLQIEPVAARRDFIRLVNVYHHAAILYSYRCLGYSAVEHDDKMASVAKLFEELLELESPRLVVQNLAWPVFIAGTECYGDAERQQCVSRLLTNILETMGFKNYVDLLGFLNAFWNGTQPDWQQLSRELQANGFRILAV